MRSSEYYGVQVPELGDRADITVVSQSIIDSEDNQSGKVENLKATLSGSIISLTSESRTDKLIKYYNGLAVQFISPVNAQSGTTYKIKIDNLAEQPYQNKVDIKVGDIVQAIYGSTGFITASSPMHNELARKATKINAGKGLTGGGDLSADRTIDVGASDDSITVEANGIKVNTYDNVNSTSTTRPASAGAVKKAYDKANTAQETADNKLDKGNITEDWNSAEKIKGKVENGLIFKGTVRQTQINSYNTKIGVYDIQEDELVSGLDKYWSVLNFGEYTNAKTQLAFPYQFGVGPEMYLRTSSPSGWKSGGWKRVWHDGNFDPSKKLSTSGGNVGSINVDGNIYTNGAILLKSGNNSVVMGSDGHGTDKERFYFYFTPADSGSNISSFYKNGALNLRATNLKTKRKDVTGGINELKDRFENSPVLYTNSGSSAVTNLNVPNLYKYRLIAIKYQVGANSGGTPQNGRDITQTIMYMDDENNHFHLFSDGGRVRYTVEQNKLIREYEENATRIVIRKIYGLVEK